MKPCILIVNPHAGQGRLQDAIDAAAAERPWLEVQRSSSAEDARRRARRAVEAGVEVLAVGGGDGTVHDVVAAVADAPPPALAVVPLGTANDLAKTLGVPLDDPAAALDLMRSGRLRPLDLARMTDADGRRVMVNAATAGFSDAIEQAIDDDLKARWRSLAYLRAAVDVLPTLRRAHLTVHVDGVPHTVDACAVLVANGRFAGGFEFAPRADADDGMLDVLAVTTDAAVQHAGLSLAMAAGQHLESDHVWAARGEVVQIDAHPAWRFRVDGESVGRTPARFEVVADAVRFMTPEDGAEAGR